MTSVVIACPWWVRVRSVSITEFGGVKTWALITETSFLGMAAILLVAVNLPISYCSAVNEKLASSFWLIVITRYALGATSLDEMAKTWPTLPKNPSGLPPLTVVYYWWLWYRGGRGVVLHWYFAHFQRTKSLWYVLSQYCQLENPMTHQESSARYYH